jgi:hypothetical protein
MVVEPGAPWQFSVAVIVVLVGGLASLDALRLVPRLKADVSASTPPSVNRLERSSEPIST